MARIQIGTDSIYYHACGHANATVPSEIAVVFIHGSGGSHKSWPTQIRSTWIRSVGAQSSRNVSAYLMDLPGHGQSTGKGMATIDAYADFIEAFVSAMSLRQVVLAGHSLGGAISLQLALRQPEWLAGLVLVGTGARLRVHPDILDQVRQNYEKTIDLICRWAFGPDASEELIEGSKKALLKTDPEVTWGDFSACTSFDVVSQLGNIKAPALIVSAVDDALTPPKYGRLLNKEIENSQFCLIKRAGHMMAIEKPDEFLAGLTMFLSELHEV
jgi:pimeloyl-ACP methyl ester carboxylesterase